MPISYGPWQSYPWKNELALQSQRVAIHYAEMLSDDFDGHHNPMDMLDRALILSGFAIRRMVEKRLITDKLTLEETVVRTFPSKGPGEFRPPCISHSGGSAFRSYNFEKAEIKHLKIGDLANEIIHASQLMFVRDEDKIPTGLLVASDWHLKNRLLHLTIDEFTDLVKRVLDDQIRATGDHWDFQMGTVHATRE
ncbi:MAG: hypothetical protein ABSC25_08160 [Roseiarcus sp.]|jgi:hypothetical protein